MVLAEVSLYNVVLFVHIAAAILAFGVTFAYPLLFSVARRGDERSLPFLHRGQGAVGRLLITPATAIVLLAGVYLALEGPYDFGEPFVGIGIAIILVLLALGGLFFARQERRLAELAERDVAAAHDGPVTLSDEYERSFRLVKRVGTSSSLLVLVAVFVMVTKPGT